MQKLIAYAFLLLFPSFLISQNTWCIQTANPNSGLDGIQTSDGNFVTFTNNPHELMKVDQNGQLLWVKAWDASAYWVIHTLVETSDNGLAVLGTTADMQNTLLIRLDANANVLWEKRIELWNSPLQADWLCPTHDDGGLLLGGGECTLWRYIIRLDNQGNEVWLKQYTGFNPAQTGIFWNVIQAPGTGYYLTYNRVENGDADVGLMKIDETGAPLWAKWMDEGPAGDEVTYMRLNSNGEVAMIGATSNYSPAGQKLTFMTYDGSGNLLNYKVYTDSSNFSPVSFVQTTDGGYLITGNALGADMVLVKTDASGNIQWQGKGNHSNAQISYAMANAPGGMAYLTGWDLGVSHFIAKIDPLTGQGLCGIEPFHFATIQGQVTAVPQVPTITTATVSYFNVTHPFNARAAESVLVCGAFGTAVEMPLEGVSVGPNPFANAIKIELEQAVRDAGVAELMDMQGRVIARRALERGSASLDWEVQGAAEGMLILRLTVDGRSSVTKLARMAD